MKPNSGVLLFLAFGCVALAVVFDEYCFIAAAIILYALSLSFSWDELSAGVRGKKFTGRRKD